MLAVPRPSRLLLSLSVVTTVVALAVAGCGSSSSSSTGSGTGGSASTGGGASSGGASGTATNAVSIKNYAFAPKSVTVKVGSVVTWTNTDAFDHSIVDDGGAFTGTNIKQNMTYTHTYDKPGTFAYHCGIHNYMTATLTVTS